MVKLKPIIYCLNKRMNKNKEEKEHIFVKIFAYKLAKNILSPKFWLFIIPFR